MKRQREKQYREREAEMTQRKIRGSQLRILLTIAWLALTFSSGVVPSRAQQRRNLKTQGGKSEDTLAAKVTGGTAQLTPQFTQAKSDYESSLEQLLALHDADAKNAEGRLLKMKELCEQGLVTRREVEEAADSAARAREEVAEVQAQLKVMEVQFAEALVEAESEDAAPNSAPKTGQNAVGGWVIRKAAYIRYGGERLWSLSQAGVVEQFFRAKFGHALPVSAFGQSSLHDRWGYDHHNAMDVPLSPESVEGQALIEYLRTNGIPFTAFHHAITGSATGPHIHVGLPSHRIAPR